MSKIMIDITSKESFQTYVKGTIFPDGQSHIQVSNIEKDDEVEIIISLNSQNKLIELKQISNALKHIGAIKTNLYITYLMGARYDRIMLPGDSLDLEVFCEIINSCEFQKVYVLDVHNEEGTKQFIPNLINVSPDFMLIEEFNAEKNLVLIIPDKGAMKKLEHYKSILPKIQDFVYCEKTRDLETGRINLVVNNPELCENKTALIIDDLCDGGGTFLSIASQIKPRHSILFVTHGIFSKGFDELGKYFNEIITTNSFADHIGNSNYDKKMQLTSYNASSIITKQGENQ